MRVRAFAKINRSLRVLGTRADGYHELRTIFQSIALHDTLTIRRVRGPFRLTCDDPACPADEHEPGLARGRAACGRASGRRGAPRDVAIDLRKRIPMQAGLGGGSSDAAAALRALGEAVARRRCAACAPSAAALGADVPYFFEGGTALGLERGDLLFPLLDRAAPRGWCSCCPAFGVSTKDAFGWFDARSASRPATPGAGRSPERLAVQRRAELVNDLEAPVVARHPEIGRIISALRRAGAVSGGDVGQRLGGIRPVFRPDRPHCAPPRALGGRSRRDPGDADPQPPDLPEHLPPPKPIG